MAQGGRPMIKKELLKFVAEEYDFDIETIEYLPRTSGKMMNQVYSFNKDNKKYIIKFEPPNDEYNNQLIETRALMDCSYYLAQNNVNVAKPLKTKNDELVPSFHDANEYIVTAFEWLNGKTWAFNPANQNISFNWGKAMGDMHRVVKKYTPSNETNIQKDIFQSRHWGTFFDKLKIYPNLYQISQQTMRKISDLPRDKDSFGIIHKDMHQGNIFIDGEEVSIFDFGDSVYGWFALDIAISLCHALWWGREDENGNDYTNLIIENFIKGYLSANQLSDFWLAKIPLFMKYRQISFLVLKQSDLEFPHTEWINNIENNILFEDFKLNSVLDIIKKTKRNQTRNICYNKKPKRGVINVC